MFPLSFRPLVPLLLGLLLGLTGCTLDRSGLSSMPGAEFSLSPSLACPGDTITFTWNTQRPFNAGYCRFPNGNTAALQSCDSNLQCVAVGGLCVDSFCNNCAALDESRRSDCASPSNAGCQANLVATVEVVPASEPPLSESGIRLHRGEHQFVVRESSTVAFRGTVADGEGLRAGLSGSTGRIDADVRIEVVDTDLTRIAPNTYECRGAPTWPGIRLEELFAGASPNLRLISIHNPNGFRVVGNLNGAPLDLIGDQRSSLNLPIDGPVQAQPAPEELSLLPPVQCSATQNRGSYPSAPLELTVGCVSP